MNEIRNYSEATQAYITKASKEHNGDGEICYPYSFGYSLSEMYHTLERLKLNKRQLKELAKITDRYNKDIKEYDEV
jgi:hypothetical protein